MNDTSISWTELSWNPVTGCNHAGTPECDERYAKVPTVICWAVSNTTTIRLLV